VTVTGLFMRGSARVLPWQQECAVIVAANPEPPGSWLQQWSDAVPVVELRVGLYFACVMAS